ncbi:transmembrane protein 241-like isoform X2 [Pomacea canaliculata]|nr:transmembrane protein 241-like isoform X2 [Pomacea canaliculata]XP_025090201.1 transmembrane protein 241-like isoform X2 [Pomacea canaliculata]XP_025090202.1 transmembrane protein 241-like isoform X2 [Pomacea canaliculata]
MLIVLGYVGPLLKGIDRYSVAPWMPGMMLFLVSIYAGSRALANLPIPVYFCMQNTVLLFKVVIQIFGNKKLLSICSYMMLMVTAMSSVAISITDPQFSADGYFWMAINILSRGFFHVYSHLIRNRLESLDRLYCCYIYSLLMLAPCSYLLGDALEAVNYPYLYFTKFYLGCIFSGVLGIFLNLTAIQLQKSDSLPGGLDFSGVQAISRILGSIISFFIFPTTLTANFAFLLAVNQLCSVVVSDAIVWHPLPTVIPSSISSKSSASLPDMEQLEQNKFQKDMLRVELE